jgi:hypothetical protein
LNQKKLGNKGQLMKKQLLLIVPVLMTSVCLAYFVSMLDKIVHGTLYDYGLQFSYEWANPYWAMLRIVQVLLIMNAAFSIAGFLYLYREDVHGKPKVPRIVETKVQTHIAIQKKPSQLFQKQKPRPEPKPEATSENYVDNGLTRCNHCGKTFSQPLRMLDFHEERPKMIDVCPFCSEVIQPVLSKRRS